MGVLPERAQHNKEVSKGLPSFHAVAVNKANTEPQSEVVHVIFNNFLTCVSYIIFGLVKNRKPEFWAYSFPST